MAERDIAAAVREVAVASDSVVKEAMVREVAPRVVTLGETMALLSPDRVGALAHVPGMSLSVGGAESNVAIGLRRLGVAATWIGRVGDDPFGRSVIRALRAEDLDVRATVDDSAPTGLMVKERRTSRTAGVWYYRAGSAGSRLSPADVTANALDGATLLHVTGITPALSATAADAVRTAVRAARERGMTVSFDVNLRTKLWSPAEAAKGLADLVRAADVVFAGTEEAELFVGAHDDPLDTAAALCALGPSQAVVKLGSDGCAAVADGERLALPAIRVDAVDTVGAGDAFVAGYLAELLAAKPLKERLRTAIATGAFACTVPGDWEGLPTREELSLLTVTENVAR
ncbi:sugar kinase [Streptomyces sp. NPDC048717]|uniref:sugar kinase n=1 Tax=unclassified Streptomyces TaxID=2593676 RepID=UPI00341A1461